VSEIIPRDISFNLSQSAERNWFCNDPYRTAFCDAFSALLPEGEKHFVKSVRQYENRITDPDMKKRVAEFISQESFHTREHIDYNDGLRSLGYNVDLMESRVRSRLADIKSPLLKLSATCCIEHFTATISDYILRHDYLFDDVPEVYRNLWLWHALEEQEHKSLPYDVFLHITKDMQPIKRYFYRISVMFTITSELKNQMKMNIIDLFETDGRKISLKDYMIFSRLFFINPGVFRAGLPYYLRYYMPGFHPDKGSDEKLILKWKKYFQQVLQS
jgi:predicted metal-dependent hydrolase